MQYSPVDFQPSKTRIASVDRCVRSSYKEMSREQEGKKSFFAVKHIRALIYFTCNCMGEVRANKFDFNGRELRNKQNM